MMPDELASDATMRMLSETLASVKRVEHMILGDSDHAGILTRLSHVERTGKENARRLDAFEARSTHKPDEETNRSRWVAIGHIAVALAAFVSLAMQLLLR